MIGAYVAVFGSLTWSQQSNYGTFGFDMGIFDQEIWLVSRFRSPFITVRGLDMWANHVNPIVYLLAPAYWLGAGPHFLYALQTLALASGAVPLWLLARDRFSNDWLALAVPVAWLLYPSVEWMTWWHFHPESLAVTPFLFAWWFASRRRWWAYAVCIVLVLATKEDAALAVMALGLAVALRYRWRSGLLTAGAAGAWLVICLKVIMPAATGVASPFYADQYAALGHGTNQIIYNAIRHPSRVVRTALMPDRHDYYVKLLAPVAGLSLLSPLVLLALPTLLVNVLNNQGYPHDYRYQYQAFVVCGIFLAVVDALGRARPPGLRRFGAGLACAAALASAAVWGPSPLNARVYHSGIWARHSSPHLAAEERAVHLVPDSASVAASYSIVPHLTHRKLVYEWPNPFVRANYGLDELTPKPDPSIVDYLVLDEGLNPEQAPLVRQLLSSGTFEIVFERDQALLARRVRSAAVLLPAKPTP